MDNESPTIEEMQRYLKDTYEHILCMSKYLMIIGSMLGERSVTHDATKLMSPEAEIMAKSINKLSVTTYGSGAYKKMLDEIRPALNHHYDNNRHHPEYFGADGVNGMTLVDLIEMLCDWKSASLRHNDGDIYKSIEINEKRFNLSQQLKQIFINTVKLFD